MDRLQTIEVFLAVAETGGFAKAAQRLHLSPAAVTRAVAALEERIGVRLFNRTTRNVAPTEAGLRFLEEARSLLHQLDEAEKAAAGDMAAPSGLLTVSASVTFGRLAVAPLTWEFVTRHPRVQLSLLLLDRRVHLVEEGVDVAIRIGELPDSALIARPLGQVRRVLVASPAYLERRGVPVDPAALRQHDIIGFSGLMPNREWRVTQEGRSVVVRLQPRLEVNDASVAIEAAEAGQGITASFSYMVAPALRAGRLVLLPPALLGSPVPVHLVHPPGRLVSPKLRAFLDFAAPRLRERLAGDLALGA